MLSPYIVSVVHFKNKTAPMYISLERFIVYMGIPTSMFFFG